MPDSVIKKKLYEEQIVRQIVANAVEKAILAKVTKLTVKKFLDDNLSTIIDESVK
jgi:hypothetical protein